MMIRSLLQIKLNKSKSPSDIVKFTWPRNLVVNLQYFEKLSFDGNSKPFWKACKPYFSNKNSNIKENMLLEEEKIFTKTKGCCSNFQ